MNDSEALAWVNALPRLVRHPGVENTRRLLQKLGNPERNLKFVHIAGTNGKGSATTMLSNVLKEAGYHVGTTISPFVLDFRERFLIDGAMISEQALADILTRVRNAADFEIVAFDAVTAAAILWFAEQKCDIVCMETGLGGRLDSTNAVENTLVACIMQIGKDHTELLGDTYEKIAAEKCGIFKNHCAVVAYPVQPQEAMDEITLRAAQAQCALTVPDLEDLRFFKGRAFENRIDYGGYYINVPFAGRHQAYNATVVIEAALKLCDMGFDISDDAIINGIARASFPARIEVLSKNPLIILDGAHNVDGAKALAATLRDAKIGSLTAVMGVLHGKNAQEMLAVLSPCFSQVFTVTPDSPRAMTAGELAAIAKKHFSQVIPCESVAEAIHAAKSQAQNGIVVCGSLYLAAEARKLLK